MIQSVADLFDAFGGPAKVGQAIGKSTEHAAAMKRRGSVPNDYWPQLVAVAIEEHIDGVTYEALALMHSKSRPVEQHTAGVPQ